MSQPLSQHIKRVFSTDTTPDLWQTRFYLLIGIYLVIILITFTEYGITIDEPPQVEYGQEIIKWYQSFFQYRGYFERVATLDLERYGGLFETLAYPFTRILPFSVYDTRHLCNALIGLTGIVAAYRLGTALGSPALGLLGACFLLLTPRYYGHTFNNPKDLPFAVFYLWSIYAIIQCLSDLPHLSWKRIGLTGLAIGLALGIRVGGLVLFGYLGLFFFLRYIQISTQSRSASWSGLLRQSIGQLLVIYTIAWITMLAFWPTAQPAPLTFPINALLNFAQYGTPDFTTTLFEGRHIDINDVPRYYAPLWLLLALPEFLFLGLAAGITHLVLQRPHIDLQWLLLGFSATFPLLLIITLGTPLYDGLRHILFTIPPLVLLSAAGLEALVSKTSKQWIKKSLIGVLAVLLGLTLWDMIRLHPNEYVYFSRLFAGGLQGASERYQTDYWQNSYKQGLKWLDTQYEQRRPNRKWRLSAGGDSLEFSLNPDRYLFDYIAIDTDFYLSTTRDNRHQHVPGEIVHTVERDGVVLLYIIRPDSSYNNDPFFMEPDKRYTMLGWKYDKTGQKEKSIEAYTRALEHDPENAILYSNIAGQYIELKQYEKAEAFARKAINLASDYATSFAHLGNALYHQGKMEESIQVLRKAIELNPNSGPVLQNFGNVLLEGNQIAEAVQVYRAALQIEPRNSALYFNLGQALYRQGGVAEAALSLEEVLRFSPRDVIAQVFLGQLYEKLGRNEEAVQAYKRALKLNPNHARARDRLVWLTRGGE